MKPLKGFSVALDLAVTVGPITSIGWDDRNIFTGPLVCPCCECFSALSSMT